MLDDQSLWEAFWAEHGMQVRPGKPLRAVLHVRVQEAGSTGCLVEGSLTGSVILTCDRCAADVEHAVDVHFEGFEDLEDEELAPGENVLRNERGMLEIDAAGLVWQHFLLDLPVKTLCSRGCKGICPHCGKDLNEGPCDCGPDEGDPRLSVLRGLKVRRH
ncbi:DUF177 domain-containing protein [Desulfovibrio sp. X2]|uniref:YceD family protein n=1 Tax=Desulfovibrio sp. X2 TaxID=941449 RepID=UPI00040ABD97|nr:DUF177 domain-containing protein [Desulfovibrio sp. X2]